MDPVGPPQRADSAERLGPHVAEEDGRDAFERGARAVGPEGLPPLVVPDVDELGGFAADPDLGEAGLRESRLEEPGRVEEAGFGSPGVVLASGDAGRQLPPQPGDVGAVPVPGAQRDPAAGREDAKGLLEGAPGTGEEPQTMAAEEEVERRLGEVEGLGVHPPDRDVRPALAPQVRVERPHHLLGEVDPDDPAAGPDASRGGEEHGPAPGGHVEHPRPLRDAGLLHEALPEVGEEARTDAVVGGRRPAEDADDPRLPRTGSLCHGRLPAGSESRADSPASADGRRRARRVPAAPGTSALPRSARERGISSAAEEGIR